MTGIIPAVVEPELTGTNQLLVIVVLAIALGALAMAVVFRKQVLAAGEGTDNMKTIALAVQEGANAYLTRQFRTLGIFAVIAFFALLVLPADDTTVRIFRSVFFLVGAGFSSAVGYLGMNLAVRANLRVAAAADSVGREPAMTIGLRTGAMVGMLDRRPRPARCQPRRALLPGHGPRRARGLRLRRRPARHVHASRRWHLHQGCRRRRRPGRQGRAGHPRGRPAQRRHHRRQRRRQRRRLRRHGCRPLRVVRRHAGRRPDPRLAGLRRQGSRLPAADPGHRRPHRGGGCLPHQAQGGRERPEDDQPVVLHLLRHRGRGQRRAVLRLPAQQLRRVHQHLRVASSAPRATRGSSLRPPSSSAS